jgi:hypothetical protein
MIQPDAKERKLRESCRNARQAVHEAKEGLLEAAEQLAKANDRHARADRALVAHLRRKDTEAARLNYIRNHSGRTA